MPIALTAKQAAKQRKQQSLANRTRRKAQAISRSAAMKMAWLVAALQGALLLTFALVPAKTPPRLPLADLLWAYTHKPQFYPLIALLTVGPALSLLAWTVNGKHRALLVLCWTAFLTVIFAFHTERIRIMLRVLAWEYL